jgi:CRP/FNR family cyclic AMP-dependent transcriptional regulator
MEPNRRPEFNSKTFLTEAGQGRRITSIEKDRVAFTQGDPADAIFDIRKGSVKLTVISKTGKEALLGVMGAGDFFGEGCLVAQPLYRATATAISNCLVTRLERKAVLELLHQEPSFSTLLLSYALTRAIRIEEEMVDQLFNASETRFARSLLLESLP